MSRLQKKKPVSEKKKQKNVDGSNADSSAVSSGFSSSKATIATGSIKAKPGKGLIDGKVDKLNIFQQAIDFFREVKIELKKVTWPTRKQTTGTTIVVIIFVFVIAAFLGLFDYSLSKLVQVVLT